MIKSEPDLSIVEVAEEQVDSPIEPKYNMCNAHCASTKFTIFSAGGGEGGGDGEEQLPAEESHRGSRSERQAV